MRCPVCGMKECCGADMDPEIERLSAEIAAKDARIAELEAALYCENSPYEAKTHRCVHCDEEVLR